MKVTIITGAKNSAKTTTLRKIVEKERCNYLGYICLSDDRKSLYYLQNLLSNDVFTIMSETQINSKEKLGKFYIVDNSFESASTLLLNQIVGNDKTVVLDEIGLLELKNSGYNSLIKELIALDRNLILCIRDTFVEKVIDKYKLKNIEFIRV